MLERRVEIIKTLRATPIVLRALVDGVDEAGLRRQPGPGEWAIIEVVAHLADTEERALGRVRQMLAEDNPQLEPFDQEALAIQRHYLDRDLQAELARLQQLRSQHLAVLDTLDAASWERTGRHGEHGVMSLELYETHVAGRRGRPPGPDRPAPLASRATHSAAPSSCWAAMDQTILIQMTTTVAPTVPPSSPEALPMELARALGDPLRWRIIELLASEQLCVAHLAEELQAAQPLVSHHLKVLRQAGLIEPDRYRYWTYYRLRPAALIHLATTLGLLARSDPSPAACRRLVPGPEHAPPTPARPPRQGGPAMPNGHLDPLSRATFAHSIESLAEEFRGIYSLETIERFVDESIDRMSGARVVDFIPLFVHRFARERLRALAQAQGAIMSEVPEVLFVCVHNAGRSQMAAALLDHHAKGKVHVRSAGSAPADQINPAVAAAMDEWGIDLSKEFPKPLTDEFVQAADVVITMGCGDACPIYPGKRYEDWELQDPAGQPVEVVRRIRDDIDARVQQLLTELVPASA